MDSQRDVTDKGGTMRLGAYVAELEPGSRVAEVYGKTVVSERHRHRYEFNPQLPQPVRGRRTSGCSGDVARRPAGRVHRARRTTRSGSAPRPIPSSRAGPNRPAPLFREFVGAALRAGRGPQAAPVRARSRRPMAEPTATAPSAALRSATPLSPARGRVPPPGRRRDRATAPGRRSCGRTFEAPDGSTFERDVIRDKRVVAMVPLLDDGRSVLLVRQYRGPIDADAAGDPGRPV